MNKLLTLRVFLFVRRLFAGAERCSRESQMALNPRCGRVRTAEHAPRDRFYLLERRHGLAEIVERGGGVLVQCTGVSRPHLERDCMIRAKNTLRHGRTFAQQSLRLFEAL